MTKSEAIIILEQYNRWRRDDHIPNAYEMPNPKKIDEAIDVAIECLAEVHFDPFDPFE